MRPKEKCRDRAPQPFEMQPRGGQSMTDVHTTVREAFSALVDDELPAERRAEVELHLRACADCRAELDKFQATVGRLGGLRARAPRTFLADVQNQIRTRSRGRFFGRRHLIFGRIPFEWVSLAMIIAMLGYYIIATHSAPTHVAPSP